jgi:hypothetical protein
MSLIDLTIEHRRTKDEAARRLATAVEEVRTSFGALVRQVDWAAERDRVRLGGVGFWIEMWVDDRAVHVTGDIPILGRLLGSPLASRVKSIVERTYQKQLP